MSSYPNNQTKKSFTIDKPEPKKEKLPPELQKVKDDAIQKANKMAERDPSVKAPIQTRQGVFYPGDRMHYHQTGYDPQGEFAVDTQKRGNYDRPPDDELPPHLQPDSPYDPNNPNRLMMVSLVKETICQGEQGRGSQVCHQKNYQRRVRCQLNPNNNKSSWDWFMLTKRVKYLQVK